MSKTEVKLLKLLIHMRDEAYRFEVAADALSRHADALDIVLERGDEKQMEICMRVILSECPILQRGLSVIEPMPDDGSMSFSAPDGAEPVFNPAARDDGIN